MFKLSYYGRRVSSEMFRLHLSSAVTELDSVTPDEWIQKPHAHAAILCDIVVFYKNNTFVLTNWTDLEF